VDLEGASGVRADEESWVFGRWLAGTQRGVFCFPTQSLPESGRFTTLIQLDQTSSTSA
jgi:hypothetical protein